MPVKIIQFETWKISIWVGLNCIATEFITRIDPEQCGSHQNTIVNNKRQAINYKAEQIRNWIFEIK